MPKNRLEDLRNHLFETLEGLKDPDAPMEIDRARAVAEVAREIISSGKLELQFLELTDHPGESDFLSQPKQLTSGQNPSGGGKSCSRPQK